MNNTKKVIFTNINWDTDGHVVKSLPKTVELNIDVDLDVNLQGADILSDKYGYCLQSFNFAETKES